MGTDNLHHKRKAKGAADLKRRRARRDAYEKVLVVCEGEKTEPNYFSELRSYYGLNTANIEIWGDCGSDPMSVVDYARQRYREERDAGDAFDKIFCVIDKDNHTNFDRALLTIPSLHPKDTFFATPSVPCFEYWLLLHYVYSTRPYNQLPASSAADQVLADLKQVMPDYRKGTHGLFHMLAEQLSFAISNAKRARRAAEQANTDNPSTQVDMLIEYLQNIKK